MCSAPPMLKQWIDLVMEHGWAHGRNGNNLKDKIIFNTLTAGGTREAYAAGQHNNFTIREFLIPFEQTATLCKMIYLPPFANKLGVGSVLGYLLGGIIIGPFFLGLIGQEGKDIMHFAEFGVVMMLFLAGLELDPSTFWRMRKLVLGAGSLQVGLTSLTCFALFLLLGFNWQTSLAIGLALSMSSTAIIMQTFREKGLTKTQSAKSSLAVSIFQDVSVIPILALLPLLAVAVIPKTSR